MDDIPRSAARHSCRQRLNFSLIYFAASEACLTPDRLNKKKPRAKGSGLRCCDSGGELIHPSSSGPESVVHTNENGGCFCVRAKRTASRTGGGGRGKESPIARPEVIVVAFQEHRPV